MKKAVLALFLAARLAYAAAPSQDEDAMFGSASAAPVAESSSAQAGQDAFSSGATKEDPLQIGGVFYQQVIASPQRGLTEGQTPLSLPLKLDAFLDARPNDRIRAFIDARLLYDSTRDSYGNPTRGSAGSGLSGAAIPSSSPSTPTAALPDNPQVVLDSAWLKFDLGRMVFVSAGKQHVKWGSGRIWNPSDALNPARRDPLQPYDLRLGSSMLKFDLPLQSAQSSLSAIALFDNPQPASTLEQVGGAFRAETVLFGAELGVDMASRAGLAPVYGADLSMPLGPLDFRAEAAILSGTHPLYQLNRGASFSGLSPSASLSSLYSVSGLEGHALQASIGADYSFAYMANRLLTAGGEYFYNELGSESAGLYPILVFLGQYQPFYAGKHYAALYFSAEGPDESKHTSYNLSCISNLSDLSVVTRLDFNWHLLEYLDLGIFGDLHYGNEGGEFNFTLHTPALTYGSTAIPPLNVEAQPFDAGMSLRVSF